MVDPKVIGERIAELRKGKGLSQEDLAKKVGTSDSAIGMYERGERIPRDEIKVKIAKYFGKSVNTIFFKD